MRVPCNRCEFPQKSFSFISSHFLHWPVRRFLDLHITATPLSLSFSLSLSLSLCSLSSEYVSHIILSTPSPSRAAGPVGTSIFFIHRVLPGLASSLAFLFNASLRLSHFPSSCKRAFVRPLLKVNSPTSPSDNRPRANLCELTKIFEKVPA